MSKKSLVDSIEVKNSCSQDWNEMKGGEKVRLCGHCDLYVNNISELTRKQALKLVREANGKLCVRYVKNPSNEKPVYAERFYKITRRARIAAGVLGATLSLSALTYAQGEAIRPNAEIRSSQVSNDKKDQTDSTTKSVSDDKIDLNTIDVDATTVTMGMVALTEYRTGLHLAVSNDDLEQVREFIAKGEGVNQKDDNYSNITPLFLAVENGNTEIVEALLNFGAKVNIRDDNRQTPLMRLDEDAGVELVSALIKHGARLNLLDKEGNNALILAARVVKPEVLQLLINYGAKIDVQNRNGRTALMEAAEADNVENVRALLLAGASVNLKDKNDETAYDLTTDEEIEKLLAEYGAEFTEN